ncbi:MAG: hypothetical protein KDE27_22380 [Planctomycetes bacterium]|nr:hypothetical protein [Planctomycetota bacterium]
MSKTTFWTAAFAATVFAFPTLLPAQRVAWAWVSPGNQGATFTPSASWQYSSSGSTIFVTRDPAVNNRFTVHVPNLSTTSGGVVHATAHNGNHTAVVTNWGFTSGELRATIELHTPLGGPADNKNFSFSFQMEGDPNAHQAHMWANQPTAASYTPSANYLWNGNRADPTITRSSTGVYQVRLPGLANTGNEFGNVQLTGWGSSLVRANCAGWTNSGSDLLVDVRCQGPGGTLTDAAFVFSYNETDVEIDPAEGSGSHLLANLATEPLYQPLATYAYSNGRNGPVGQETIERLGVGRYRVNLPNVVGFASSNAQVTTYGFSTNYATLRQWGNDGCGGSDVLVDTYDRFGAPIDTRFMLRYVTNRPASKPAIAWAWIVPSGQPNTFTPSANYRYASNGGAITVTRNATQSQLFTVRVAGIAPVTGGSVHACAWGGNHTAVVNSWGRSGNDLVATIELFTPSGSAANDAAFNFYYRYEGDKTAKEAYCWADDAVAASYNPNPTYAWNGDRGAPLITHSNTGIYQVRFPNLGSTGSEGGNVQITPHSFGMRRAKVQSWFTSGSDVLVNVRCYDAAGALADGRFICSYNEVASPMPVELGSGAHVWANNATAASYTPNAIYTDSNGTLGPDNAETITRLSTGRYRVHLPNVAPSGSSTVQVTAHGSTATFARVETWVSGAPTGTDVTVRTFDASGNAADSTFSLFYLTNRPAVVTATNTPIGSGCNGVSLAAITRPILCRDWHLDLNGVPSNAVLGFMQLDLTNPNFTIGVEAPGCMIYTNGAVTALLFLPVSTPAFTQPIPNTASLIGVSLYAQGGAFVPNINQFWLAASNGLRGTIGDN